MGRAYPPARDPARPTHLNSYAAAKDDWACTGFPAVILSGAKELSGRGTPRWRADGEIPRLWPRDDRFTVATYCAAAKDLFVPPAAHPPAQRPGELFERT